jgi:hypothetical protein
VTTPPPIEAPKTPREEAIDLVRAASTAPPPAPRPAALDRQLETELRAGDGWSPQRYIAGPVFFVDPGAVRILSRHDAIIASGEWRRMLADPTRAVPRCQTSRGPAQRDLGSMIVCFQFSGGKQPILLLVFCEAPRTTLHSVFLGDRRLFQNRTLDSISRNCPPTP